MSFLNIISDASLQGVMNGWDNYVTGSTAITVFILLMFLFIIGMLFRIDTILILIFLIPFTLVMMAYSMASGWAGIILLVIGLLVGWVWYMIKRF